MRGLCSPLHRASSTATRSWPRSGRDAEPAGAQVVLGTPVLLRARRRGRHRALRWRRRAVRGALPAGDQLRGALGATRSPGGSRAFRPGDHPAAALRQGRITSSSPAGHRFRHLIYPVPVPGGLGTHVTLDLAGQARFGPDVQWVRRVDYGFDEARAAGFYRVHPPLLPAASRRRAAAGLHRHSAQDRSGPGSPAAGLPYPGAARPTGCRGWLTSTASSPRA